MPHFISNIFSQEANFIEFLSPSHFSLYVLTASLKLKSQSCDQGETAVSEADEHIWPWDLLQIVSFWGFNSQSKQGGGPCLPTTGSQFHTCSTLRHPQALLCHPQNHTKRKDKWGFGTKMPSGSISHKAACSWALRTALIFCPVSMLAWRKWQSPIPFKNMSNHIHIFQWNKCHFYELH